MHWAEDIKSATTHTTEDGLATLTVWAGAYNGTKGLPTPPESWAADDQNDVAVWLLTLKPKGKFTIPAAAGGKSTNRALYTIEGEGVSIDGTAIKGRAHVTMNGDVPATVEVTGGETVRLLMLQGKPIGEKVVSHGPFVMNSREEIEQAFSDYRRTQFGGWPWPEDAMVFPQDKGRFALVGGKETHPPK